MSYYTTIFRQILQMIPRNRFDSMVRSYRANRYTKHFTAWSQFIVNLYAQISGKDSLRQIESGLRVNRNSYYHLGLKNMSKSHLSYVNERRDYRLYQALYYHLYDRCLGLIPQRKFKFKYPLQILDATVIKLCLSMFPWARFRKRKGAIKIHTLLNHQSSIPSFLVVTDAKKHDVTVAKKNHLPLSPDSILVMDMAYIDFEWFRKLDDNRVFYITRAKKNMRYEVLGQQPQLDCKGVLSDQVILPHGYQTFKKYPRKLRRIEYYDEKKDKNFTFITNHFNCDAKTIADIYKTRWDIEIFFKWIKQNLKIKHFLGTSENAVMTQIWTALIYYLILAYIKYQTKYKHSMMTFTIIFKEALFKNVDIIDLLNISPTNLKNIRDPVEQRILIDL
jgi:hypothetical protein